MEFNSKLKLSINFLFIIIISNNNEFLFYIFLKRYKEFSQRFSILLRKLNLINLNLFLF
jgi:hypothetical protein